MIKSDANLPPAGTGSRFFGSCWRGFPPSLTVDGLCRFRRRNPLGYQKPQDNLKIEDSLSYRPTTEYKTCFQPFTCGFGQQSNRKDTSKKIKKYRYRPLDSIRFDNGLNLTQDSQDNREKPHIQNENLLLHRGLNNVNKTSKNIQNEKPSEVHKKYILYKNVGRPSALFQTANNFRMENGDFRLKTENAEKFIKFILTKRPQILRKSSTLKPEGTMSSRTECRDKFVPLDMPQRPPLIKKETNLQLEGKMELEPEYKKEFVKFDFVSRPTVLKHETNLQLEGNLELAPEYRQVFVEYPITKVSPTKPTPNLKPEGSLEIATETNTKFIAHPISASTKPARSAKYDSNLHLEGEQQFQPIYKDNYKPYDIKEVPTVEGIKHPTNLNLEGTIEFKPDYRENYVQHSLYNLRAEIVKKTPSLNLEGEHAFSPGYKEEYTFHKIERTEIRKPENNLKSPEGKIDMITESSEKFRDHLFSAKKDDTQGISEDESSRSELRSFSRSRSITRKIGEGDEYLNKKRLKEKEPEEAEEKPKIMKPGTKSQIVFDSEGVDMSPDSSEVEKFKSHPEYRKAYHDYIQREQVSKLRQQHSPSVLKEISDNEIPAVHRAKKEKAFHLISKDLEQEKIRLGFASDQENEDTVNVRSPKKLPIIRTLQERSPSPKYRMHVTNVDDNRIGFRIRRRRSQDIHPVTERRKSSCTVSSISSDRARRVISPSVTSSPRKKRLTSSNRISRKDVARKAFVVLDKKQMNDVKTIANHVDAKKLRSKSIEKKKCHTTSLVPKEESNNWMPPWFDVPI